MLIGLDVGGTHTDAVLLQRDGTRLLKAVKAPTRPHDLLAGILEALEKILEGEDASQVRRLCVSTTVGLNALLTGAHAPVGMLAVPGPGVDPRLFWGPDPLFHVLSGALDHRGRVVARPRADEISGACAKMRAEGARALGVVCKFSPKNPELEREISELARKEFGPDAPVIVGASAGGSLNFPRRLHTVLCNAALAEVSGAFADSLEKAAARLGLSCPLVVLKADAGVYAVRRSVAEPASSMGSGPAASLLGVWARASRRQGVAGKDLLMIDMGGTSTDLALMFGGHPLLAPKGLTVCGRPTLIRALWTRSIALGGDSALRLDDGRPVIGPDRSGPALALEKGPLPQRPPTLVDALNALGHSAVGDCEISREALTRLAASPGSPATDQQALAGLFVSAAIERIREESALLLAEVNSQPAYTIRDLLVDKKLAPAEAVLIGGPAAALAKAMQKSFGMPLFVPEESAVTNALGAALAKATKSADLYADTLLGRMSIPDFGIEKNIDRSYDLQAAWKDMRAAFDEAPEEEAGAAEQAPDADLQCVFAESFAMLDDNGGRGRNLRLRVQQAAGLLGA